MVWTWSAYVWFAHVNVNQVIDIIIIERKKIHAVVILDICRPAIEWLNDDDLEKSTDSLVSAKRIRYFQVVR